MLDGLFGYWEEETLFLYFILRVVYCGL
jgi:hypothetical protein